MHWYHSFCSSIERLPRVLQFCRCLQVDVTQGKVLHTEWMGSEMNFLLPGASRGVISSGMGRKKDETLWLVMLIW